ncbi:MAG: DUF1592 domain-containing protein [Polyangiaceae bacterium]
MSERLPEPTRDMYPTLAPAAATLPRLTQAQFDNAIQDLLGDDITLPTTLEPDTNADGLFAVGASVANLSQRGAELYEDAAKNLAQQAVKPERRNKIVSCSPAGVTDDACLTSFVTTFGKRVYRRPLSDKETQQIVTIGSTAATALGDFWQGLSWSLAALLQSPYFLYRVERQGDGSLDAFEKATRLSFFLWNSIPDQPLLDAAEQGELDTDSGYRVQAERMLADPRSKRAVRNFFSEWLGLQELDSFTKDPNIFKHYSPDLGPAAREETLLLAEHIVLNTDGDLRDFFTTKTTFVNRRLAALYNVPAPSEESFGMVELGDEEPRRGFLGQVSFLGLHSHPVSSSPTERGVFLRENILCQQIPSPPSNLNTAIPEVSADAKTLRQRLTVHMENPSCASCHRLTDVVGLGFENFDGIGRYREVDNGERIDPSGDLDGAPFNDFTGLTDAIASDPRMTQCFVKKMFTYALQHPLSSGEQGTLDYLHDKFDADGRHVKALMLEVVLSDAFRARGEVK